MLPDLPLIVGALKEPDSAFECLLASCEATALAPQPRKIVSEVCVPALNVMRLALTGSDNMPPLIRVHQLPINRTAIAVVDIRLRASVQHLLRLLPAKGFADPKGQKTARFAVYCGCKEEEVPFFSWRAYNSSISITSLCCGWGAGGWALSSARIQLTTV